MIDTVEGELLDATWNNWHRKAWPSLLSCQQKQLILIYLHLGSGYETMKNYFQEDFPGNLTN